MAKSKANGTPVILRAAVTQAAANGFIQASLLTGLSNAGNDALIVKQITIEYPSLLISAVGLIEHELTVSRASKAAIPNIFDDDVLYKDKFGFNAQTNGVIPMGGVEIYTPLLDLVIIEDTLFVEYKTVNCTTAGTVYISILCEQATVTESEKVGILLTRLN